MTLDEIEKRALDARMYPGRSSSEQTAALAAAVIVLVEECRLARAWLHAWEAHWTDTTTEAEAYRAFLAKRGAP